MNEEFRHHLELRTEELIRRGITPREAARRARIEFGHVETHKEAARASRGLRFFDQIHFSWLDVKLGLRMLRKYPALSLVSVIGMSVAIAIAGGYYGAIGAMIDPTLPLTEGDRIVSVQNADITDRWLPKMAPLAGEAKRFLESVLDRVPLSARAFSRVRRVARTLADLAGRTEVAAEDLAEAVQFRGLDLSVRAG